MGPKPVDGDTKALQKRKKISNTLRNKQKKELKQV